MSDSLKRIHVVVGVLLDPQGRILISRRPQESHLGGLWEFPGGKVEAQESAVDALARELREELDVDAGSCQRLISLKHHYPDRHILLDCYLVNDFEGEARGAEGQPIRWVGRDELIDYSFPEANQALINALTLPDQYMITGAFDTEAAVLGRIDHALQQGVRLLQLRFPGLPLADYCSLIGQVASRCESVGACLMVKGDPALLERYRAVGLHLTARQLHDPVIQAWCASSLRKKQRPKLAASCHNLQELQLATGLGVDFITYSPIATTASHPHQAALGWSAVDNFVQQATMPVYLLGGMQVEDVARAKHCGAQGIAAISCYWC